jgi:hypothetical protein
MSSKMLKNGILLVSYNNSFVFNFKRLSAQKHIFKNWTFLDV